MPGALAQQTGGYIYDARMVAGLRGLGWHVVVHELDGEFPDPDARARECLVRTLGELPDQARVLVDGLATSASPDELRRHRARLRILALIHHPLADETGLEPAQRDRFAALEREALALCAGVLVTSEFTASRMRHYGVPSTRVRVVRPGTNRATFARGPAPGEPPRLLCVASVTPRKGQDVLVRALARLRALPWVCICAGSLTRDPTYARLVRQNVTDAELTERIRFMDECDPETLADLYDSSSVFVLASRYEGYGMALSDALARGLPIVSTTGGAIPHTVPPDTGILVPPGDDEALANAVASLLAEEPAGATDLTTVGCRRRSRLARAARQHAGNLPDWEAAVVAFAGAIIALTDSRRVNHVTDVL